jgi:hypothetical protein
MLKVRAVLLNVGSLTAANLLADHTTFRSGHALISWPVLFTPLAEASSAIICRCIARLRFMPATDLTSTARCLLAESGGSG